MFGSRPKNGFCKTSSQWGDEQLPPKITRHSYPYSKRFITKNSNLCVEKQFYTLLSFNSTVLILINLNLVSEENNITRTFSSGLRGIIFFHFSFLQPRLFDRLYPMSIFPSLLNPEDLPEAMNNREKWRERVRDIRAGGTTSWWWWFVCNGILFSDEM